jgi:4-amino-4-deoxy-L-arabinose transferase-like glycosyltransferase
MTRIGRQRIALGALLLATALLYLLGLSRSGWANPYYAAAAQAASQSWKAFLFGSFDSANFITVDKTPASLWLMGLSVRMFGLSSFAILLPQALCGVGSVALLYAAVRRWTGHVAGLIAGAVLALTPVAVLMFRFNNPDALLVLLLVAGAYGVTRAVQSGQTRWLAFAGAAVGFGFLTKMLQAFLVLPAFGLTYLIAGPPKLGKRLVQLGIAFAAMIAAAGWWVALVELWPASSRPYIGGSQNNSIIELTLGYNGFGRLTGDEVGSVGGGGLNAGGQASRWGETGLLRMFNDSYGGQASWLIPAALLLMLAGFWITLRRKRTDPLRAGFVLWGGWLLTTALTFSLMQGIIHEYYTVALAPAIGALVGGGGVLLWRVRRLPWAQIAVAGTVAITGWWAYVLLGRSPSFLPWLRWTLLIGGLVVACALLASRLAPVWTRRVAVLAGLVVGLAGPAAFAMQTAATAHNGAIVTAGPASVNGRFGPGGAGGPGGFGGPGGANICAAPGGTAGGGANGGGATGTTPGGTTGTTPGGTGTTPGGTGTTPGATGTAPGGAAQACLPGLDGRARQNGGTAGQLPQGQAAQAFPGGGNGFPGTNPGAGGRGGMGGLLNAATPSAEVQAALNADADKYTWVAATTGANNAAGYQLALQKPVMAIGGFNGSDDAPSLEQFQQWVAQGRIHYFLGGGGFGGQAGGSRVSSAISAWVTANFTAKTVGGVTLYDLTEAK